MKKKIGIILLSAVLLLGCTGVVFAATPSLRGWITQMVTANSGETIALTVNGEPIYQETIELKKSFYDISRTVAEQQMQKLSLSDAEQSTYMQAIGMTAIPDEQIIRTDLIRNKVMLQEAQRRGLSVSDEAALTAARQQYEAGKAAALADNPSEAATYNYNFITEYRTVKNWSEEEYLQESAQVYKDIMLRQMLYKNYAAGQQDATMESFEAYVDTLVDQAEIVLK